MPITFVASKNFFFKWQIIWLTFETISRSPKFMKNKFTPNAVQQKFTWRSIFVHGRSQKSSKSHNNDRQIYTLICSLFLLFNQNYFDLTLTHLFTKFKRNIKQWRISNGHKAKNEAYLRKFRRNGWFSKYMKELG